MNRTFRKILAAVTLTLMFVSIPTALAALKVWTSSETIQAVDLNANFNTVNAQSVAQITDSRVSSSAAIQMTKISGLTAALLPKAWLYFAAACGPSCTETLSASSGVASLAHTASTGVWTVTWSSARVDALYAVFTNTRFAQGNCYPSAQTTTTATISCFNTSTGAAIDTLWTLTMFDNL